MSPPRIVVEPAGDLDAVGRELVRAGWRRVPGGRLPDEPWDVSADRLVVVADLASEAEAQAALLAAVRGAALAVRVDRRQPWAAAFLADLDRLGDSAAPAATVQLTDEQRQLLDLLSHGTSIAEAARRLFLSLRTANRRVAEARDALGVATTREAVLAYARLRDGVDSG